MAQQRLYTIPKSEWERLISRMDSSDVISEKDAAELLRVKSVSLQVARSRGTIPPECYTKPVVGNTVYLESKLLNIK